MSEEFIKGTDRQTDRRTDTRTELLPELLSELKRCLTSSKIGRGRYLSDLVSSATSGKVLMST